MGCTGQHDRQVIQLEHLTYGPFQENMYLLTAENGDCALIDPGNSNSREDSDLRDKIEGLGLNPVLLLLTHCHIDHVMGCDFVHRTWGLIPQAHPYDQPLFELAERSSELYGIPYTPGPEPQYTLKHGEHVEIGGHKLEIRLAPGHAPGHVVFVHHHQRFVIGGDVFFKQSVGRVDLPMGDGPTLARSIRDQLYTLPGDFLVHPGHGPATTVGYEMKHNPFVPGEGEGMLG